MSEWVSKKKSARRKHVPQRTCVGCREVLAKRSLIRVVRGPQGVQVDPTGKLAGRGAYLHDQRSCWEKGLHGALAHALKVELSAEEQQSLAAFAATLPAANGPAAVAVEPSSQETPAV
jgi:predicted RNA-binding protein YlxR (DUF448 family)